MTEREAEELIRRRAWTGRKPGLERIRRLLGRLGDPQKRLKFVHIAGSNGKGSTAAMLASVLTQAGLKTGLYTSPHLWSIRERFQVDGAPIPEEAFGALTERVLEQAEDETEFELMTAIGMVWFLEAECDIVVLETGLGGRLDSTNVIDAPEAVVITRIGLEHTELLGDTLVKIATEKAGIMKEGCYVVLYEQGCSIYSLFEYLCHTYYSGLALTVNPEVLSSGLEGQSFTYRDKGPYHIPLLGEHQVRNAAVVLETVNVLQWRGWDIPEEAVLRGLERARWPGRMELVRRSPDVILDGGHNPQCMEALAGALGELYPERKLVFLTGVLADKDHTAMMGPLLPLAREFFTLTPDSPRALPAGALAGCLEGQGVKAAPCGGLREGLDRALESAGPDGAVCVCGSLYMIGEARHLLGLC
ncbi:bifunctional folylpolyglutamate synthase/dihydrofolate synthase [Colidextribacter sp. OB.20]|uniref:bifunctional folylpolyglutamate synthase/dihydrofolate synthase n=1 Tax=Colidextribacter sp. OB.20 TaxID=2304568 RepID=UPI00136D8E0A|nr:folylpolyglutamate synthase/dihydrofolate synthase family protein [Colidextribacter sp. OB.20]NBI11532.1 bifunctional folylpolyglutamate synthase/dihydrofolate synthase [Colidextribacter sp. OB.20]